jgi:D-alanyl-D-alanine dipeptidase
MGLPRTWRSMPLFLGALALSCTIPSKPIVRPPKGIVPADTLQLLVVRSRTWESVTALAQRYERDGPEAPWRPVGEAFPAVVGRIGLAWGTGLHPRMIGAEHKREGDGRAPAGVFRIGTAFGYEAPSPGIRVPYIKLTHKLACIEDDRSIYYNQIVDKGMIPSPDFVQSDNMLRDDDLYRLGLFVGHNSEPAIAGDGSCIFIHVWRGPQVGTAGCTAARAEDIRALATWLRPEAHALLVQLPEPTYEDVRKDWALP